VVSPERKKGRVIYETGNASITRKKRIGKGGESGTTQGRTESRLVLTWGDDQATPERGRERDRFSLKMTRLQSQLLPHRHNISHEETPAKRLKDGEKGERTQSAGLVRESGGKEIQREKGSTSMGPK